MLCLLISLAALAAAQLQLGISSQLLRDAAKREAATLETLLIDTITAKKYNKNLDVDYDTLAFEQGEGAFAVSVGVAMRKGPGQVVGTFTLVLTQSLVPDTLPHKVTRQSFVTRVSIRDFKPRDDEGAFDRDKIVGIFQEVADYLNQWTSETMHKLKPSDLFVFNHALYRGIGHLASSAQVDQSGTVLFGFKAQDLYIKGGSDAEHGLEGDGGYLSVRIYVQLLSDALNDLLRRA